MRGWSSVFAGFLLLGAAYWSFTTDGFGSSTLMCAAAAAFLFFRGAQGLEVDAAGDPTELMEFVRDPADAIVDNATEKITDWFKDDKAHEEFDPDAAVARYLAQRGTEPSATHVSPQPQRGFGRKGI